MTFGDRLEEFAGWVDRRPAVIVTLLAGIYVFLIAGSVFRHLWFDELHTFYIAQAPSIPQLVAEIPLLDMNPPLSYLLVRASLVVCGNPELGARLPMILGFFLGSMGMFAFVVRRAGSLWAAAAVGLFWFSPFIGYATESRPYGILMGGLGLMLLCWDPAIGEGRRKWALAGLTAGNAAMILSHVYAPLWVLPFWAAELMRAWRARRIDWPLWCALVLPFGLAFTYVPMLRNAAAAIPPPVFVGAPWKAPWFLARVFLQIAIPLVAAAVVGFAIALWRRTTSPTAAHFRTGDSALLLGWLLPPLVINVLGAQRHVAFYDRHALLTVPMECMLLMLFLAFECRTNRLAGAAAGIVILALLPSQRWLQPAAPREPRMSDFQHVRPDLPLVTNSALTFLQMDRYEDSALVARLYYLVDLESALRYDHSNLTEGLPTLKKYFPIRGTVSQYSDFAATHRRFLVWGVLDQSGWLLRKLKTEGAQVNEIGKFDSVYADPQLFEVNLDP